LRLLPVQNFPAQRVAFIANPVNRSNKDILQCSHLVILPIAHFGQVLTQNELWSIAVWLVRPTPGYD
jgi:hypothetical protein